MQGLLKKPRSQAGSQQSEMQTDPAQPLPGQGGEPGPGAGMPGGQAGAQQPGAQQPGLFGQSQTGMDEEENDENHPVFKAAMTQVMTALYKNGAADKINEVMVSAQNPLDQVSTIAYELTAVADEKTGGELPEDLVVLLGSNVLAEVLDIAEGSGIDYQPADVAQAFKTMLLRYLGENGYDTTELDQAMSQVSPEQINQLAAEVG